MPKINFAAVFDVALRDLLAGPNAPSMASLWERFEHHLRRAIAVLADGLDFHMEHMHQVFPELVLDLLCYGPIENGLDASHGGVEFYNLCVDGAALATVADSFAAVEQRVEHEGRLTWDALLQHLDADWAGPDGEQARRMMRNTPRYGAGGARADSWAERIAAAFTQAVVAQPTPAGYRMIPGLFSWALNIAMGKRPGRDAQRPPRGRPDLARREPRPRLPQGRRADRAGRRPSPPCSPATATPAPCRSSWIPACRERKAGWNAWPP